MKSLDTIIFEHINDNNKIIGRKREAGSRKEEYWDWILINAELREIIDEYRGQEQ